MMFVMNHRGKGVTYFHEHGHLIDFVAGRVSNNQASGRALRQDVQNTIDAELKTGKSLSEVQTAISNRIIKVLEHLLYLIFTAQLQTDQFPVVIAILADTGIFRET